MGLKFRRITPGRSHITLSNHNVNKKNFSVKKKNDNNSLMLTFFFYGPPDDSQRAI